MTTAPALPESRSATVEDRVQISRRFIHQAGEELERGDRLQATEKIWGALAQLLKAHGQQRGWLNSGWLNMGSHRRFGRIAQQLAAEYDDGRILNAYIAADNGHRNFYDNEMSPAEIEGIIAVVAGVLPEHERTLREPPCPFVINDVDQRWRVRTLTGKQDLQVGDASPAGFSNTH